MELFIYLYIYLFFFIGSWTDQFDLVVYKIEILGINLRNLLLELICEVGFCELNFFMILVKVNPYGG